MEPDSNQNGSSYDIRSLYFDDIWNNCLLENYAGVDNRKKYRVRIYDPKSSAINLEIKEKTNGMTKKTKCSLTRNEFDQILDYKGFSMFDERKVLNELYLQMKCRRMEPKIIIEYERTAFVHKTGNIRITFDRNINATSKYDSFFDAKLSNTIPVLPVGMNIMEVKYDELIPDILMKQLEIGKLEKTSFSKYYMGRMVLDGHM